MAIASQGENGEIIPIEGRRRRDWLINSVPKSMHGEFFLKVLFVLGFILEGFCLHVLIAYHSQDFVRKLTG